MDFGPSTLGALMAWLLRNSWQASVLIALVLLAQWMFRKQLAPRWRYALWLLVLIRLALPAAPESSLSVFNLGPQTWARNSSRETQMPDIHLLSSTPPVSESSSLTPGEQPTNAQQKSATAVSPITNDKVGRAVLSPPLADGAMRTSRPTNTAAMNAPVILSILWFGGALSLAAFTLWFPFRLNRQLAHQHSLVNPAVREVLADCQRVMNVRRVLPVVQSQAVNGPALMGFIRPWLLLPEGMLEKFTPEELRFVFLHELAHLKRRDIAVNWLMTFLLILHWFNPLVWFAFARMRADRELACDALALSYANERETKPYGQTILKLLDGFTRPAAVAGLVGILENPQQLKRRIAMIAQFKKSSGWPAAAVALIALLGCVSLTDSKKENASASNKSGAGPTGARVDAQPVVRLVASDKIDRWVAYGDATPSPNGKYLSYVNWNHGNLAFYNIETGELRDLTTEGTWSGNPDQFSWEGVWSPDSTQIAYLWNIGNGGELRIVHRDGGKPRTLVATNLWPRAWSKDGRYILAVGPNRRSNPEFGKSPDGIQLVDTVTGKTTLVKQLPDANDSVTASLSPDGKFIAYSYPRKEEGSTNSAQSDIRIVNIDGSNDRGLVEHPADDFTPHWMPDGKHLLFVSDRSGTRAIWMLPINNGQKAGEPRMVRDDLGAKARYLGGWCLGVSDDGIVFYATRSPSFNIYVAEVDWDATTMGAPKLVSLRYDGKNRNPRWSSDGSKLGYVSHRDPGVMVFQDAATGKEEDVKAELGFFAPPAWAPDLSRLVGPAKSPTQKGRGLFELDTKTGRRSLLEIRAQPTESVGDALTFTPDGKHLLYFKESWITNTLGGMVELDLTTRQERRLQKGIGGYYQAIAVSRDGSRLASCNIPYPAKADDKIKLVVSSRTDGAVRTVAEFPIGDKDNGRAFVYEWLPDNQRVLMAVQGTQFQQMYLVDTETGNARPFGPPQSMREPITSLSIHPDGKRIAFERGRRVHEIWTMKNFLPAENFAAK